MLTRRMNLIATCSFKTLQISAVQPASVVTRMCLHIVTVAYETSSGTPYMVLNIMSSSFIMLSNTYMANFSDIA